MEGLEGYKVLTKDMELVLPQDYKCGQDEEDFRYLVRKEALKQSTSNEQRPLSTPYFKRLGMDWEEMSDSGHMRFQPKAALMHELISQYAWQRALELGIPVFQIKGTNMFNLALPPIKKHADLFGDALYKVPQYDEEGKVTDNFVLKFAACHQQFAAIKHWNISHRQLPFGAYDNADSYRNEKSGSLLLGFRVRRMNMPDLHIFSKDLEDSKRVTLDAHRKIFDEFEGNLGRKLVNIYNISPRFFEENPEYMRQLMAVESSPALLNFVPEGKYYWVINVEHNIIDSTQTPREIATFQIDMGNSQNFELTYVDQEGSRKNMPIIHTALVGTVERYFYSQLETLAQARASGVKTGLPVWLTPTQTRICPVNDDFNPDARILVEKLRGAGIRADYDDRNHSVSKKVAESEKDLVSYTIVFGDRERQTQTVGVRSKGKVEEMTLDALIQRINTEIGSKPRVTPYFPYEVSKVPIFV